MKKRFRMLRLSLVVPLDDADHPAWRREEIPEATGDRLRRHQSPIALRSMGPSHLALTCPWSGVGPSVEVLGVARRDTIRGQCHAGAIRGPGARRPSRPAARRRGGDGAESRPDRTDRKSAVRNAIGPGRCPGRRSAAAVGGEVVFFIVGALQRSDGQQPIPQLHAAAPGEVVVAGTRFSQGGHVAVLA